MNSGIRNTQMKQDLENKESVKFLFQLRSFQMQSLLYRDMHSSFAIGQTGPIFLQPLFKEIDICFKDDIDW